LASRPGLFLEPLEQRDCPSAFNPNDVLVVQADTLEEFTTGGTQVQQVVIPFPGGRPQTEEARGVVIGPGGAAYIYNGNFSPYLSSIVPATLAWTHTTLAGWSLAGTQGYGEIGRYQQYIFAPDMNTAGAGQTGIVRFDTSTGTATRFVSGMEYRNVAVGLDGKLYGVDAIGLIDVYDPIAMTLLHSVDYGLAYDIRGLAADANGNIFIADWGGGVYELDPTGNTLKSLNCNDGNLTSIDISAGGQIVVGQRGGDLIMTTAALTSCSIYQVNQSTFGESYVAFADPAAAAPAITSPSGTVFTVGVANSFTVTTSGSPTPTLSDGGYHLPAGLTFTDNGNGTATIAGTPTGNVGGTYNFTITASNGVGTNGTQSFALTVDQAPAITSASSRTFTVGAAGTFTIQTTGFPAPSLQDGNFALPSGLTFTDNGNGTAALAGTPTGNVGGTYSFTVTAHNGSGSDATQSFTLTVNQAPAITSAANMTFTVGQSGSFTVRSTGYPVSTISDGTAQLPAGVSFHDNGDGTAMIAGTPTGNVGGTYPFTITAHNGVGSDATQAFTLTVNQAPGITSANNVGFVIGQHGSFTVQTTGFPNVALNDGTFALPSGVTFTDNGNGTATLSGTPGPATAGVYTFTIDAGNGIGSDATQTFTLTVGQVPDITSADSTTFTVGQFGGFTVQSTGSPLPKLSDGGFNLPGGLAFVDNGDGTATLGGTPIGNVGGIYVFTISASNGVGTGAMQTFTLTVDQSPAIASTATTTFTVGSAGTFTVQTRGFPAPSLQDGNFTLPSGVTFTDNGNGTATLAGTPTGNVGSTYTFTITASNGIGGVASQNFTLTIDQAPAITSASNTTFTVGVAGSFTVRTTGFPIATLNDGFVAMPGGLSFTNNGDGTATLAGTPEANTGGTFTFTIDAGNGIGSDAAQTFTLTIDQPPAILGAGNTTFAVGSARIFIVNTTGFPQPALSDGGFALPAGVTFHDNGDGTAVLAGTPTGNSGGTYAFTITAHNGTGSDATLPFTLTVNQAPAITSAGTSTFTVGQGSSFLVKTAGFPGAALNDGNFALPGGVTFTDNGDGTATLAGTPAADMGGTYSFTITAHNGIGSDAKQTFTLTVHQAPAITSAGNTTFTVGQAGTFTVNTTGFPLAALNDGGFALPHGVTFTDNSDGTATLAGTPTGNVGGTYTFTITDHNAAGADATQAFTLTVDQAPAVISANTTTFVAGQAGSFTVKTAGFPLVALADGGFALPTGVAFTDNGDGTGTLAGTPAGNVGGPYAFTITAGNGIGSNATQAFTLIVDRAPSITSLAAVTFLAGNSGTFNVTTTAGYPTATSLSASGDLPAGIMLTDNGDGTGTLAGTPAANAGGSYPLTITAHNGAGNDTSQPFTLTIDQGAAVTSANHLIWTVDTPSVFTLHTSGFPTPSLQATGLPGNVSFTDNGDGTATLAGTVPASAQGIYSLTVTAHNGIGSDFVQTFTLTAGTTPAVTSADATTFTVGVASTFTVKTSGFPAAALSEAHALPSGVSFTDNGNGTATLAGTPAAGTAGSYPLIVTADNGTTKASQPFALTVNLQPQSISFDTLGDRTYGAAPFALSAAATSGLPVAYRIVSGPAILSGNTVTITGAGTVAIEASQPGDGTYGAAAAVTQSFTVRRGQLRVTADNQAHQYGQNNAPLTYAITGFVNDENATTAQVSGTPALATFGSAVGAYAITVDVSGVAAPNYDLIAVDGVLTIKPAHLTVTADTLDRVYGQADPAFTATITGFVYGETLATSGVTGAPAFNSSDAPTSLVGKYTISPSLGLLAAANYDFPTFVAGVLNVDQANTNVTFQTNVPPEWGMPFTLTTTVGAVSPGAGTPTGTITLYDGSLPLTSATLDGGTVAMPVAGLSIGTHFLSVYYSGDLDFASAQSSKLPVDVLLADTATLVASPRSIVFGQSLKLTATVRPAAGAVTMSGTVTFLDGATPLGTVPLVGGKATLTTTALAAANHQLTAVYNGNTDYRPTGSTTLALAVSTAKTQASLAVSSSTTPFGAPVMLTAKVSAMAPSTVAPTGSVTFMNGTTALGSAAVHNGVATLSGVKLTVGKHALTAVYGGANANDAGSSSAFVNETVVLAATTLNLTASPGPTVFGQPVAFTAAVNVVAPGVAIPGGTVTFKSGSTVLGTANVSNGNASITTVLLAVGTDSITATYGGDLDTARSSATQRQVVGRVSTTVNLNVSPSPGTTDQPITLTAQISVAAPGSATPVGTVVFKDGKITLGSAVVSHAVATLLVKKLAGGTHSLTAVYSGDGSCLGNTSNTWLETIN
jgi:hypothetical protein